MGVLRIAIFKVGLLLTLRFLGFLYLDIDRLQYGQENL